MLHIPAIYPGIILVVIIPGAHSSGEIVIKVRNEIAVPVFGMEEQSLGIKKLSIVGGPGFEIIRIFLIASSFRKFGECPAVICRTKAYSHRLAVLPTDIGVCLNLSRTKRGNIPMLPIETVQLSGRIAGPRNQGLLRQCLPARLIGSLHIYFQPFCQSVGKGRNTVIGVHSSRVTADFRESRHPASTHLLGHP